MSERKSTRQIRLELLLKHGYRPDQLIPDSNGEDFRCSPDDLSAAMALVKNPHGLTVTDEMKSRIKQLILNGYMPHQFSISARGTVLYDTETVDTDNEAVMFSELLGPE